MIVIPLNKALRGRSDLSRERASFAHHVRAGIPKKFCWPEHLVGYFVSTSGGLKRSYGPISGTRNSWPMLVQLSLWRLLATSVAACPGAASATPLAALSGQHS